MCACGNLWDEWGALSGEFSKCHATVSGAGVSVLAGCCLLYILGTLRHPSSLLATLHNVCTQSMAIHFALTVLLAAAAVAACCSVNFNQFLYCAAHCI
jgi:hypothetical protein